MVLLKPDHDIVDVLSAVGSLATFGAFIFLFVQQYQNNNAQKRTETQLKEQQDKSNVSQFESSLFNLLNLYNQIVEQLEYLRTNHIFGNSNTTHEVGKRVFNQAFYLLRDICEGPIEFEYNEEQQKETSDRYGKRSIQSKEEAKERIVGFYHSHYYDLFESLLNHYFRNLYHIYKYIDKSKLIDDKRRKYYASIVRAQLSQNELYVIMFNMIIQGYGYPNMLILDRKYEILKNFNHSAPHLQYFYELYLEMKEEVAKGALNGVKALNAKSSA